MLRDESNDKVEYSEATNEHGGWREVDRELRSIAKRQSGLDAELMAALRDAERVRLWHHLGHVSMMAYLEHVFGYSPKVAQERLRVARKLESLPELTAALASHELPFSSVRELTRIATPATELSPGSQDLGWQENEPLHEGAEVHAQYALAIGVVALAPSWRDRDGQGEPRLERPSDSHDHHVGPVGVERVERGVECTDAALELREEVFLVAAMVGLAHHLLGGHRSIVGGVEEVAVVLSETELAALLDDGALWVAPSQPFNTPASRFEPEKWIAGFGNFPTTILPSARIRPPCSLDRPNVERERAEAPDEEGMKTCGPQRRLFRSAMQHGAGHSELRTSTS